VSGPVIRGTLGLYIQQDKRTAEAADACGEFIQQLRSLLDEIEASPDRKRSESQLGDGSGEFFPAPIFLSLCLLPG